MFDKTLNLNRMKKKISYNANLRNANFRVGLERFASAEDVSLIGGGNAMQQLGAAFAQQQGVIDISNGQIISDKPKPKSLNVTVNSIVADGDEDATIYLFNNTALTPLDTNNGGGANTLTYNFRDGYSGRGYERLLGSNMTGFAGKPEIGIGIRGFTIQVTTISTGASNGSYWNAMDMNIEMANLRGRSMPFAADLTDAIRNTAFIAGTLTVIFPFVMNPFMQITYTQSPNTSFAWSFVTEWGKI